VGSNWYVSLILGAVVLFMAHGWDKDHKTLIKERTAHTQEINNFKVAQDLANQKAEATRVSLQKEAVKNAQAASQRYDDLYDVYHANLLRYQASQSGGKQSGGGKLPATQSADGSGKGSQLSISLADAEICAVNTARLQSSHQWAEEMLDAAKEWKKQEGDQPEY